MTKYLNSSPFSFGWSKNYEKNYEKIFRKKSESKKGEETPKKEERLPATEQAK